MDIVNSFCIAGILCSSKLFSRLLSRQHPFSDPTATVGNKNMELANLGRNGSRLSFFSPRSLSMRMYTSPYKRRILTKHMAFFFSGQLFRVPFLLSFFLICKISFKYSTFQVGQPKSFGAG